MARIDISPLSLGGGLQRGSIVPESHRPPGYMEELDRTTLWYDALWQGGRVHLVCPAFNDLWPLVRRAEWRLDGRPAAARIRRYRRHAVVELAAPVRPAEVAVTLGGWTGAGPVSPDEAAAFAGLNCAFCFTQDNRLEWLHDYALHHRRQHGLQGLVLIDNRTALYDPAAIEEALAPVGLEALAILNADLPFGPRGLKPYARREKFMQTALFNVLRLRVLRAARAVLFADVDELVVCEGSIFERAARSPIGYVRIPGHWVYPADPRAPPRHAGHVLRAEPPERCPPKYCLRPQSWPSRRGWDVHHPVGLSFLGSKRRAPDRGFLHCRAVTTHWKSEFRREQPGGLVPDAAARRALAGLGGG